MGKLLRNKVNILVFIILVAAAFLRLYKISDYMTFLGDEGRDVLVVYNILHGHLTLLGPNASVGGFFLGPIYYYFMAPFLFMFNYDPVGPAVMVALFGIATVWLVYYVGKKMFDTTTGIFAATFYSVSPLVISYSRSSWNPNLMPFFSLLIMYLLYLAVSKKSLKQFVLIGILYGIAMQLHYIETFLGVIILVYVFLSDYILWKFFPSKWDSFKQVLIGLFKCYSAVFVGFLIGLSPFLAFEVRHGFPNIRSIFQFIFFSGETGESRHFLPIISDVSFRLFGRLVTNFPPPEQVSLAAHPDISLLYTGTILLAILAVSALLLQLYNAFKNRKPELQKFLLFFVWLLFGVGLFGLYKKSIYDYYFGFMFPLPFLLVADSLSVLYHGRPISPHPLVSFSKKTFIRIGRSLAILIGLVLLYLNLQGVPFRYPANRQKDQVKEISDFVLSKTNGKPFNFALITGGNSDYAYRYFFKLEGHDPVVIQNPQIDPDRNSVTGQLMVVCETDPCAPLGNSLWEVAGFGRAEIAGVWQVSVVKIYRLVRYKDSNTSGSSK